MTIAGTSNANAKNMDKNPVLSELAQVFAGELSNHVSLSSDMTVLGLGCGTGLLGVRLGRPGSHGRHGAVPRG